MFPRRTSDPPSLRTKRDARSRERAGSSLLEPCRKLDKPRAGVPDGDVMSEMKNIDESLIRAKAFELWLDRGAPLGSPESDWFSAKMLLESMDSESAPPSVSLHSENESSPPSDSWQESVPLALSIRPETSASPGSVLSRAQRRAQPKQAKASKARAAARR